MPMTMRLCRLLLVNVLGVGVVVTAVGARRPRRGGFFFTVVPAIFVLIFRIAKDLATWEYNQLFDHSRARSSSSISLLFALSSGADWETFLYNTIVGGVTVADTHTSVFSLDPTKLHCSIGRGIQIFVPETSCELRIALGGGFKPD